MQYKIPIQIENEDPIFWNLSLRQLAIIGIGFWIAYSTFWSLQKTVWSEVAMIPAVIIWMLAILIAIFKSSEMTFVPFFLTLLRYNINLKERIWKNWVDSYPIFDIWFVIWDVTDKKMNIDTSKKKEQISSIDDVLKNI